MIVNHLFSDDIPEILQAGTRFQESNFSPPNQSVPRILIPVQKSVHIQPVDVRFEPGVAGAVRVAQAETVAAVLVEVKLDGPSGLVPGLDQAEFAAEQEVVGGDGGLSECSVAAIVNPAPAENPIMPMRCGSTCHSAARDTIIP